MDTILIILGCLVLWFVVAILLALFIGRIIKIGKGG